MIGRRSDERRRTMRVVGRHTESGAVLVPDALLPADLCPGDLLAIPAAGASQLASSSGYNLLSRPPVIAVHEGTARTLLRRESLADILSRDLSTERPSEVSESSIRSLGLSL
jgi:diaminopimelate decarboxylase